MGQPLHGQNPGCGLPQADGFPEGEPVLFSEALPEATDSGDTTAGEGINCSFLIGDFSDDVALYSPHFHSSSINLNYIPDIIVLHL